MALIFFKQQYLCWTSGYCAASWMSSVATRQLALHQIGSSLCSQSIITCLSAVAASSQLSELGLLFVADSIGSWFCTASLTSFADSLISPIRRDSSWGHTLLRAANCWLLISTLYKQAFWDWLQFDYSHKDDSSQTYLHKRCAIVSSWLQDW